jgi:hypothetical protein
MTAEARGDSAVPVVEMFGFSLFGSNISGTYKVRCGGGLWNM